MRKLFSNEAGSIEYRNNCRQFHFKSRAISSMIQFPLSYLHWRLALMLRTRLKRGRKVTSSRYYSCSMPNNRFSQYVSISLAFQCLTDGRPFCSAFSFPLFSLSALSSARVPGFLSQNFHLFQFLSHSRTLLLSFILLFSRGYRKLSLHLSRTTFLLLY